VHALPLIIFIRPTFPANYQKNQLIWGYFA